MINSHYAIIKEIPTAFRHGIEIDTTFKLKARLDQNVAIITYVDRKPDFIIITRFDKSPSTWNMECLDVQNMKINDIITNMELSPI